LGGSISDAAAAGPSAGAPIGRFAALGARAWADAFLVGWLPVIAINAVFVQRVHVRLTAAQELTHHLYDAGQILALATLSWLATHALWRAPKAVRVGVALASAVAVSYVLLETDLESFLERHAESSVPWRAVFAAVAAAGLAASCAAGLWLARSPLRFAGVAIGSALAVANHFVLELDYPGAHFLLAWSAALLIGASAVLDVAKAQLSRWMRAAALSIGAASFSSFFIVPGPVVRSALLGSSGAVAAPFVAEAWTALEGQDVAAIGHYDPAWFRSRHGLPPIPAERFAAVPEAPIVILLTVAALRADAIDGPNVKRKAVMHLRAMASRSLSFLQAWSPASYTMASLRSLFMGTYYFQQPKAGPRGKAGAAPKDAFLAELLRASGVESVNVKSVRALDVRGSVCRGFGEQIALGGHKRSSKEVVEAIVKRLDASAKGPLFVYAHVIDPHAPYTLGSSSKRSTDKERYLAEVSYVDKAVGTLRRELRKRGLEKRAYLIVSADHAEAFGEHGHNFHATTVYEEMIHVPLIIEGPGIEKRRVRTPVTLLDVTPTILSLFGVDTPAHFMGQSLVPFMRGESPELSRPLAVDGGRAIRAMLFDGRWKAIVDVRRGTEELYDLKSDPSERTNLAERPEARTYFATLRAFFASAAP
jgi:hypothetical protein